MPDGDALDCQPLVLVRRRVGARLVVIEQIAVDVVRLRIDEVDAATYRGFFAFAWTAPDEHAVAVAVTGGTRVEIHLVDVTEARTVRRLSDSALPAFAWCLNGAYVYVPEGRPGSLEHRRPVRGQLSRDDVEVLPVRNVRALAGSPDGTGVLMTLVADERDVLMLFREDGKGPQAIAAGGIGSIVQAAWTPSSLPTMVFIGRAARGELLVGTDGDASDWRSVHSPRSNVLRAVTWTQDGHGADAALVHETRHGASVLRWAAPVDDRIAVGGELYRGRVFAVHQATEECVGRIRVVASSPAVPARSFVLDVGSPASSAPPWPRARHSTRVEWISASDGVALPCLVTEPRGGASPPPTIVSVYGGFGLSMAPVHSPAVLDWLERGGRWVQALVRGGGEEGALWHRAGRGRKKIRSVLDVIDVVASFRRDAGGCSVGLYGESIGGLLVTAAAARRPDLVDAVVAVSPVTLVHSFHEQWPGVSWIPELGDPRSPEDARALAEIDPLRVTGHDQPALLISVGSQDRTVPVEHSRELHRAWTGHERAGARIEIAEFGSAGHGWESAVDAEARTVRELAFFRRNLLGWQQDANP